MDKSTVNEVVSFLKDALHHHKINVEHIALFGSSLSGNLRPDSDIDMIIISADFAGKDIFERSEMTMHSEIEVIRKFKVPMDIINLTPAEYNEAVIKMFYPVKIVA
jgi:predicted nucleotidyltransferase